MKLFITILTAALIANTSLVFIWEQRTRKMAEERDVWLAEVDAFVLKAKSYCDKMARKDDVTDIERAQHMGRSLEGSRPRGTYTPRLKAALDDLAERHEYLSDIDWSAAANWESRVTALHNEFKESLSRAGTWADHRNDVVKSAYSKLSPLVTSVPKGSDTRLAENLMRMITLEVDRLKEDSR